MKRTGFKRKNYPWNKKQAMGVISDKETKEEEWNRIKEELIHEFKAKGIYYICELRLDGCINNKLPLHFAHSKKRSDIAKEEPERTKELKEVIRVCPNCHDKIEYIPKVEGGKKKMYEIVTEAIKRREERLLTFKK